MNEPIVNRDPGDETDSLDISDEEEYLDLYGEDYYLEDQLLDEEQ